MMTCCLAFEEELRKQISIHNSRRIVFQGKLTHTEIQTASYTELIFLGKRKHVIITVL